MAVHLDRVQPVLMVRDVSASISFFVEQLGFTLAFADVPANPKYAGVKRDGVELHLQWHDAKAWDDSSDRPTYRIVVQDVDGLFEELRGRGTASTPLRDTPWGTREFHVHDPDRNGLQFYRAS